VFTRPKDKRTEFPCPAQTAKRPQAGGGEQNTITGPVASYMDLLEGPPRLDLSRVFPMIGVLRQKAQEAMWNLEI